MQETDSGDEVDVLVVGTGKKRGKGGGFVRGEVDTRRGIERRLSRTTEVDQTNQGYGMGRSLMVRQDSCAQKMDRSDLHSQVGCRGGFQAAAAAAKAGQGETGRWVVVGEGERVMVWETVSRKTGRQTLDMPGALDNKLKMPGAGQMDGQADRWDWGGRAG
jgi:hypothetical protein